MLSLTETDLIDHESIEAEAVKLTEGFKYFRINQTHHILPVKAHKQDMLFLLGNWQHIKCAFFPKRSFPCKWRLLLAQESPLIQAERYWGKDHQLVLLHSKRGRSILNSARTWNSKMRHYLLDLFHHLCRLPQINLFEHAKFFKLYQSSQIKKMPRGPHLYMSNSDLCIAIRRSLSCG